MISTPHLRQMFQFFEVADPALEQEARRELDMLINSERDATVLVSVNGVKQPLLDPQHIGGQRIGSGYCKAVPVVIVERK